jgi:hypothetical protein
VLGAGGGGRHGGCNEAIRVPSYSLDPRVLDASGALGAEFESVLVNMLAGEHRSPAFLRINPAGKLPVLVDGDLVLTSPWRSFSTWLRNTPTKAWFPSTSGNEPNSIAGFFSQRPSSSSPCGALRVTRTCTQRSGACPGRRGYRPRGFQAHGGCARRAYER